MSANNIVVIKKEEDGKFRGYHRDYDAYCEGQYDYDGPCQFCSSGCEMCNETMNYTSPKEDPIFEAGTIEASIHAYHKWLQEAFLGDEFGLFYVEYGYTFEGLEPNEETVKAMEESEKGNLHEFESIEELIEELHRPTDTELLDFLQQQLDKNEYTGKVLCRKSTSGRGWRLHETTWDSAVPCVRRAILDYMRQIKKKEN